MLSTAAQGIAPILILPVQRLALGMDALGYVILAAAIANFTGLVATHGIADAVLRRRLSGEVPISSSLWLVRVAPLTAIPSVAALIGLFAILSPLIAPDSGIALILGALSGLAVSSLLVSQQSLRADERPWSFLVTIVMWHIVSPLVGVGLVVAGFGTNGYLWGWAAGLAAAAAISIFLAGRHHAARRSYAPVQRASTYFEAVHFGFPILLHTLVGTGVATLDRTLLAAFGSGSDVAYYQAIYLFGLAPGIVLAAVNNAWGVHLFKSKPEVRWETQRKHIPILAFLAAGMVGFVILLAKPALALMLGPEADLARPIVATCLLSALALTQVLYLSGLNAVYMEGLSVKIASRTVPCAIGQGVASALLIPFFGYLGPCIAIFAFQSVQAVLVWRLGRVSTGMKRLSGYWFLASVPVWLAIGSTVVLGAESYALVGLAMLMVAGLGLCFVRARERGRMKA